MTPPFKFVLIVLGASVLIATLANADPLPSDLATLLRNIPRSTADWHRFNTLKEAALYDAQRLEECSHYYECSGVIAKDPHGRFVTGPVRTDYVSDGVGILKSDMPSDWEIVANIHSHPCVPHHAPQFFSEQDMLTSVVTRTPMYMVDMCSGEVHEFIPGKNRIDEVPFDGIWLSAGNIIGKIAAFPEDPVAKEGI